VGPWLLRVAFNYFGSDLTETNQVKKEIFLLRLLIKRLVEIKAMYVTMRRKVLQLHERVTGRRILDRLDELNHTQWLNRDELQALQRAKLQRLVEYAYQYVPYYRRIFDEVGFMPSELRLDLAHLSKLPILTKTVIRENQNDLLTTEPYRRRQMSKLSTSGSTGQPLIFKQDTEFRDSVTADIQRHMGWAGWKLGDLQALIWGAGYKTNLWNRLRTRLIDRVWNRIQLNAYVMTDERMTAFAERICRENPRILFGYATCVYRFAQFISRSHYTGITFDGIFSSAEMLLPSVKNFIEATFSCSVFNRYGTRELGGVACECEAHTGLHVSAENNYVEILQDRYPIVPGEVGEIIVTNLNNLGMPFIRYSIGDAGAWYTDETCSCGRESSMLKNIEGRIGDSLITRDGNKVWSGVFSAVFNWLTHPAIIQYQIVQKSLNKIAVRLVLDGDMPQSTLDKISQAIQVIFGDDIVVDFEFLDEIPLLPSGKHQYVMSELNRS
jgi:phenylacetate-CoA ligase